MISFKVKADIHTLQVAAFENDFRTTRPYYDYVQAAQYCVQNDVALDRALDWIDRGIYFRVMGEKNFRTLATVVEIPVMSVSGSVATREYPLDIVRRLAMAVQRL